MGMRVIEPGNDSAAARIDDFGRRPTHGFKLAARADPDDLVAANRDRLGARGLGIERDDLGVFNNNVGLGTLCEGCDRLEHFSGGVDTAHRRSARDEIAACQRRCRKAERFRLAIDAHRHYLRADFCY